MPQSELAVSLASVGKKRAMTNYKKETVVSKIQVYDPALCCSTGICGVDVDQEKITFAANVDWLKSQGGQIERFNLAQQPQAFAENPVVKSFLGRSGAEALPLILVDGQVALAGRYPHRTELAKWAKINQPATDINQGGGCCNGKPCC